MNETQKHTKLRKKMPRAHTLFIAILLNGCFELLNGDFGVRGESFIFNLKIELCESAFGCLNRRGLLYSMFIVYLSYIYSIFIVYL